MSKCVEKMMSGMVKPEDMLEMMNAMMNRVFEAMPPEERISFVMTLMPNCLRVLFAEMDGLSKDRLVRGMIENLVAVLKEQLALGHEGTAT